MHCNDISVLSLMRCCHKKHMGSNKQVQYVLTQTSLTKSGSNMISQSCESYMFNIPEVICYNSHELPCALPILLVPISTSFPPVLGHIKQFFFLGKGFITGWAVCPTTYSDLSTIWLTLLWTHPLRFELTSPTHMHSMTQFQFLIPLSTVSIIAVRQAKTHSSVFVICVIQHLWWLFPSPTAYIIYLI